MSAPTLACIHKKTAKDAAFVVAFEPHPENYNLLLSNIRLNHLDNVITLNSSLSDFDGKTRLYITDDSNQHSLISESKSWIEVTAKTIKTVLKELNLRKIDVLKIDAEGAELNILKGAGNKIVHIGQIVCAAYHIKSEANEIEEYLSSNGFQNHTTKNQ
jgi:FkbM family methyltransferase